MADDDDDDVAITEGQEAEVSIEDHRAGVRPDAGDDDDDVAIGVPSGDVVRRGREVSPRTKELFAKAAADLKRQLVTDGNDEFGAYDEGDTRPEPVRSAPSAPVVGEAPAQVAATQTEQITPPAPSLAPEIAEYRSRLDAQRTELDAREVGILERERSGDLARVRSAYLDHGAPAIRDLIKGWLGKDATEDDIRDEVADLITDLSVKVLGVDVPSEVRHKIEAKRALRSVKALKDSLTESETARTQRLQDEEQKASKFRAIGALDKEITNPERAKLFPFLSVEDNPGEIVYEVCEAQLKKDGTMLEWTEAAKRADQFLRTKASAYHDKRKHLFNAAPAPAGGPANGQMERTQGDPQGIRRSHTLTNATAGSAPTPPPAPTHTAPEGKWSREAHRAATKRKHRAAFAAEPEE